MADEERVTITSALPYIHGVPHLGNMAGSVLPAELLHRYYDVRGTENIFVCGGDVHGTPLELEALERGKDPRDIKDEQTKKVKEAYESLNVDFTIFSDTHSEYNRKQTQDMFEELYCNGLINEKTQNMAYCNDDERFLPDRYIEGECPHCGGLARGDQCDDCGKLVEPTEIENPECQICNGHNIEFRDTDHLFLDLTEYKEEIRAWIEDKEPVPENMEKQILHDLDEAEDRSITRDQDWGFEVPVKRVNNRIEEEGLDIPKLDPDVYDEKVLYVWFDAPIGYIGFTRELFGERLSEEKGGSSSGEVDEAWKQHWNTDADIFYSIGKDNAIFHTVIWPTMLLGSRNEDIEYGLPEYEFIQQYMMWESQPFSKSRGIGIDIEEATDYYPAEYWRFYLAKMLPTDHDTNFSWDDFESEINNVLNDTVGNFVNRTLSLAEQWFDNEVPEADLKEKDREILQEIEGLVREYNSRFENRKPKEALEKGLDLARVGDRYLSEEEPWNNEARREETIYVAIQIIHKLGAAVYPFIPESSERIMEMLNEDTRIDSEYDLLSEGSVEVLEAGHELGDREILFEKIDVSGQREEEDRMEDESEDAKIEDHVLNAETVSFEEFGEMDLRIGEVQEVQEHPNADKLYKVQVNVGKTTLQTCAGLKNHYAKEELEGRKVVVLANLEPAQLRGEKSECMMLAAEDDSGTVSLLSSDQEMSIGSKIK